MLHIHPHAFQCPILHRNRHPHMLTLHALVPFVIVLVIPVLQLMLLLVFALVLVSLLVPAHVSMPVRLRVLVR